MDKIDLNIIAKVAKAGKVLTMNNREIICKWVQPSNLWMYFVLILISISFPQVAVGLSVVVISLVLELFDRVWCLAKEIVRLEEKIKELEREYWGGIDPVEVAATELKTATNYESASEIFEQYPQPILYQAWGKLSKKQKAKVQEWTRRYLSAKGEF